MDPLQMAALKTGKRPVESETGSSNATRTVGIPQKVSGFAETDSVDGYVFVDLGGSSVTQDDWQAVEMPCDISVKAGDEVAVEIVDGKPRVVGRIGWGDALQTIADDAYGIATATNQHFWADANGAHVSTDANDPEGASNSLWNSLGLLIRKATNYLVSITSSAIAFYDGNGNNASNIVASFGSSGAQVGKDAENHVTISSSGLIITAEDISGVVQRTISEFARRISGIYNLQAYYESFVKLTDSGGGIWAELASGGTDSIGAPKYPSITSSIGLDILTDGEAEGVHIEAGDLIADGTLSVGTTGSFGGNISTSGNITASGTSTASAHNGFRGRNNVASTDNIDEIYNTGIYYVGANAPLGTAPPFGSTYYSLIAMGGGAEAASTYVGKQIAVSGSGMAYRSYSGNPRSWGSWVSVFGDSINVHNPTLNSNATATTFQTRRVGNVVNLSVYQLKVAASLADGSSVSLGTGIIGANARPTNVVYLPLMANVSGKGAGILMSIGTGGTVTVYNRSGASLGTGVSLNGNTTWVI